MAKYLILGSYTSAAWAAQVKAPQNRLETVSQVFERLGGSVESAYLAFGDHDIVGIADMPDNISAAAISMAITAGGAFHALKTVPLMSFEDGVKALKKAGEASYAPPGT